MSFYQPSLSLYDVLNALSNQSRRAEEQERQRQRQRYATANPQYWARGPHGNTFRVGRTADPRASGTPGYYYRVPGPYYYPAYALYDEDEDEEEAADEDTTMADSGEERRSPLHRMPSYYHNNNARKQGLVASDVEAPSDLNQAASAATNDISQQPADPLVDIINALFGGIPRNTTETTVPETLTEPHVTQTVPSLPEDKQESENVNTEPPTESKEEVEQKDDKENTVEHNNSSSRPKTKSKTSSIHSKVTTEPIQVSKPETRMDLPFSPEVNVYDKEDTYVVVLALPGATSKSFKVDYHPTSHELLVKGKIEDRLGIDEQYLKITEIKYGAFERTVKFPVLPRIKDEEIKATYSNGLLVIKVPKVSDSEEQPRPKKRIQIEEVPDEELEFEKNLHPLSS